MRSLLVLALTACAPVAPAAVTPTVSGMPSAAAGSLEGTTHSADGVPIHYVSFGSGPWAVVFVHCWGCDLHEWDGTLAHLDGRTRVVALDLAGHGGSGRDRKAWTVRAFADDVRAVVDALGLKRVVLVGHSMAGPIVVEASLAMPEQVVGLVPVDTLKDVSGSMTAEQRARFFAPMHADFKAGTEKLVRRLFPRDADPALVARVVALETANDPAIMLAAIENNFEWPEAEKVAMVKVPIVSVQGDLFPTKVEANRRVAPQFEAVVVAGTGHWPMLEKPEAFYAALDQALARMPD